MFRLPRSHWHAQLDNFDWAAVSPKSLRGAVETFVGEVEAGTAPHLILTGDPGVGKSHIGVACYRTMAAKVGTELVTWVNVPQFCENVKRSYNAGEVDPWPDVEGAKRLVVLDDLFGRDLSMHESTQILYRLIDTSYQNGAAVLVTMNQDVRNSDFLTRLPQHEYSRLMARSTIVPMTAAQDWRRKR